MRYSEKLQDRYAEEIASWDWNGLDANATLSTDDCGDVIEMAWLGSVTAIMPSGKIYTPWTTNQTARDMIRDRAFTQALEDAAEPEGWYLDEHAGDLYLVRHIDPAGEFFYSTDKGFSRAGEHVADNEQELRELMEREGYFPGVYWLDGHDCIGGYYDWETEDNAD